MQVQVNVKDKPYTIYIEKLEKKYFDRKVVLVTNPKVSAFHLRYVLDKITAKDLSIVEVQDGEIYKNIQSIEKILNHCFENRLDRKSLLIALGGGVVGDMCGFCASIYQRGIEFIQIPTTLLAQVDASVGGKTGINNKYGKNLIGTFWQPSAVFVDMHFLSTLESREFSAGLAEIVKMAIAFDVDFFAWLEKSDLLEERNIKIAIQKSLELKAKVVCEDEREEGVRALLNYGHTFAHVIENETAYETYLHGEAVAIGILMANELAKQKGLLEYEDTLRVKKFFLKYKLPTTYDIKNVNEFYEKFFLDKKSVNSKINFILPKKIGQCEIFDNISKNDVIEVLNNFKK